MGPMQDPGSMGPVQDPGSMGPMQQQVPLAVWAHNLFLGMFGAHGAPDILEAEGQLNDIVTKWRSGGGAPQNFGYGSNL